MGSEVPLNPRIGFSSKGLESPKPLLPQTITCSSLLITLDWGNRVWGALHCGRIWPGGSPSPGQRLSTVTLSSGLYSRESEVSRKGSHVRPEPAGHLTLASNINAHPASQGAA